MIDLQVQDDMRIYWVDEQLLDTPTRLFSVVEFVYTKQINVIWKPYAVPYGYKMKRAELTEVQNLPIDKTHINDNECWGCAGYLTKNGAFSAKWSP
jgi:hypothetical protein